VLLSQVEVVKVFVPELGKSCDVLQEPGSSQPELVEMHPSTAVGRNSYLEHEQWRDRILFVVISNSAGSSVIPHEPVQGPGALFRGCTLAKLTQG
jgi:hypothetical protein